MENKVRTTVPTVINLNNRPVARNVTNKLELKLPTTQGGIIRNIETPRTPTPPKPALNLSLSTNPPHHSVNNKTFYPQSKEGWDILFKKAKNARTYEEKEEVRNFLFNEVAAKLPCGGCAQHTRQHLASHEIRQYYEANDGEIPGLFKYIWEFKNAVNKRIGKPSVTLIEAWNLHK